MPGPAVKAIDSGAIQARLAGVRDRVARAAGRAGRDPGSVRVVAVSKTFTTSETLLNLEAALKWLKDAGIDDPYEAPAKPELTIKTGTCTPQEATVQLVEYLAGRGLLPAI